MSLVKSYKVTALPATPVADAIYYVEVAPSKYRVWVTSTTGVARELDAITSAQLTTAMLTKQDKFTGVITDYIRGDGTPAAMNKAAVGLVSVDNTSDANKPLSIADIAALALKANDADVLHKTGNETKTSGILTFAVSPVVPNATTATQAAAYGQLTAGDTALQTQIDNLVASISGGMKSPLDLDASTNPNYPAAVKGDNYMITVAGRIGGASGPEVEVGDWAINKANSAAGNHATVGTNWYIVQRNVGIATESIIGMLRKATQVEAESGTSDVGAMTPLKTAQFSDKRNVRYDAAQVLTTPQQAQARANIGAMTTADVTLQTVLGAGNVATNQTMSVQGPAGTGNYIGRFGASGGWLEFANGTSFSGDFIPTLKGNIVGVGASAGLSFIGQGKDAYTAGAFLMSARNAAGTGEVASGNIFSLRNFTTERFSVAHNGNVAAAGVISAIVGNSTQWSEAYTSSQWNDGGTPQW